MKYMWFKYRTLVLKIGFQPGLDGEICKVLEYLNELLSSFEMNERQCKVFV